ncbi:MAG: protein-disulfide reductase DsbD family protein, partial [Gammaproteobacteria bacterium]
MRHEPHWHTYWRNPGDSGLPTQLQLDVPPGFAAGGIQWPAPQRQFIAPLANYGYEGEIVLPLAVSVPDPIPQGDGAPVRFSGTASWLMCREVCIPGEAKVSLRLPVAPAGAAVPPTKYAALFDAARQRMPQASLEVPVAAEGDVLSIGLAQPLESAEFFPYREGLVANAEPQILYALDGEGQWARRLTVRLSADGARAAATDPGALLKAAEGVLVTGSDVFELQPATAGAALTGGAEIARVAGAPPTGSAIAGGPRTALPGFTVGGRGGEASLAIDTPAAGGAFRSPGSGESPPRLPGLLAAALFAAIGGLILNLMPCVFPVIGLKVLGFARHGGGGDAAQARAGRRASRHGALAFSAGVIVSFWILAALLLVLRIAGQAAGWGFQLQSPVFVAAMALLFVAIALNFSGVWEIGIALTRLGRYDPALHAGEAVRESSLAASFGSGVLAVLVATPCTAPFMGSALGFTLGATALQTFIVFTALGFGMALPYLLLGAFPAWLRWLPRPGRWMESFRQALAFPMYATAAWL